MIRGFAVLPYWNWRVVEGVEQCKVVCIWSVSVFGRVYRLGEIAHLRLGDKIIVSFWIILIVSVVSGIVVNSVRVLHCYCNGSGIMLMFCNGVICRSNTVAHTTSG